MLAWPCCYVASAEKEFNENPQITKDFLYALKKVKKRIDVNTDGHFSDEEIIRFVEPKIKEFKRFSFD
jgi:hypothetical protein